MYEIDPKKVGMEIMIRRIRKGVRQGELAEAVGISQTHLSNVEKGRTMLSIGGLLKIKQYLGCSLDDLLDTEETSVKKGKNKKYKFIAYKDL